MLRPLEKMKGDRSPPFVLEIFRLKMCFEDLNILNEDFFMEIFPWKLILEIFSIEVFKIFNKDLFIGDFSLKNWDFFFLKSYPEDLSFEHLKIFKEDLFMEIFPLKYRYFSLKFHSRDFSIASLKNLNEI